VRIQLLNGDRLFWHSLGRYFRHSSTLHIYYTLARRSGRSARLLFSFFLSFFLFFFIFPFFLSHFFPSGYYCYPRRQSSVYTRVRTLRVFCVSVYRHVFINPHIPSPHPPLHSRSSRRRRRQPYTPHHAHPRAPAPN